jgi:hypothetical protein
MDNKNEVGNSTGMLEMIVRNNVPGRFEAVVADLALVLPVVHGRRRRLVHRQLFGAHLRLRHVTNQRMVVREDAFTCRAAAIVFGGIHDLHLDLLLLQ